MEETLIISDLHLDHRYNHKKSDFLYDLISGYEKVIINGDLWSYSSCNFSDFLNSKWNKLFPILKAKNTIYISGNHDRKRWISEGFKLFADDLLYEYYLKTDTFSAIIKHGHSDLLPKKLQTSYTLLARNLKVDELNRYVEKLFLKRKGADKITKFNIPVNNLQLKQLQKSKHKPDDYLIVGHSHSPSIDHENRYINSGFINHGFASYISVINGKPSLRTTTY